MRTRIFNALHTTATVGLITVSCAGFYATVKGSYEIVSRRIEYGKKVLEDERIAAEAAAEKK
jgi:hypothetical protein